MESLKEIDLGNSLLSISIAAGFIVFIILILRISLLAINYGLSQIKNRKNELKKNNVSSKGF